MIRVINGYPCATPADVTLARRGLDPENPTGDPAVAEAIAARPGRAVMPAAVFDALLPPDRHRPAPPGDGRPPQPAWRLFDITA